MTIQPITTASIKPLTPTSSQSHVALLTFHTPDHYRIQMKHDGHQLVLESVTDSWGIPLSNKQTRLVIAPDYQALNQSQFIRQQSNRFVCQFSKSDNLVYIGSYGLKGGMKNQALQQMADTIDAHRRNRTSYSYQEANRLSVQLFNECIKYGNACYEKKEYQEALEVYQLAIKKCGSSQSYIVQHNSGLCYEHLKQNQNALTCYGYALQSNANYELALASRASLHDRMDNAEKALADYETLLKIKPTHSEALKYKGKQFKESGEYDQAVDFLTRSIQSKDTIQARYYRALCYFEQKNYAAVVIDMNRVIKENPDHTKSLYQRGVSLVETGQYAQAVQDLAKVVSKSSNYQEEAYYYGVSLSQTGQYVEAIPQFTKALTKFPGSIKIVLARANAYKALGDKESAHRDYMTVLKTDAHHIKSMRALVYLETDPLKVAYLYMRLDEPLLASRTLCGAISKEADSYRIIEMLGMLVSTSNRELIEEVAIQVLSHELFPYVRSMALRCLGESNTERSRQALHSVIESEKATAYEKEVANVSIQRLQDEGKESGDEDASVEKLKTLSKALFFNPEDETSSMKRSRLYRDQGQLELALVDLVRIIQRSPDNTSALFNRGYLCGLMKNTEGEIADYQRVVQLDPDHATAFLNLGVCFRHKGDSEQAIAYYSQAIEAKPDYDKAFYYRGLCYKRTGNEDLMAADFVQVAITSKDQSLQLKALGEIADKKHQVHTTMLVPLLKCEDAEIREKVAETLGNMGASVAVEPLIEILTDEMPEVRKAVISALGQLEDDRVIPALSQLSQDENGEVKETLVETLGDLEDPKVIPILVSMLPDESVFEYSREYLENFEEVDVSQAIMTQFPDVETTPLSVASVLVYHTEELSVQRLTQLFASAGEAHKIAILEMMEDMASDWMVAFIVPHLQAGSLNVRNAAATALGSLEFYDEEARLIRTLLKQELLKPSLPQELQDSIQSAIEMVEDRLENPASLDFLVVPNTFYTSKLGVGEMTRNYIYTPMDMNHLLNRLRKQVLPYPFSAALLQQPRQLFAATREPLTPIFIADTYNLDHLSTALVQDLATIKQWSKPPRLLIIPILQGTRFSVLRIQLNAQNRLLSVLLDSPCSDDSFLDELQAALVPHIATMQSTLFLVDEAKSESGVDEVQIQVKKRDWREIDHAKHGDSGPLCMGLIRDYMQLVSNRVFLQGDNAYTSLFSHMDYETHLQQVRVGDDRLLNLSL